MTYSVEVHRNSNGKPVSRFTAAEHCFLVANGIDSAASKDWGRNLLRWRLTNKTIRYHRLASADRPCPVHGSHFVAVRGMSTIEFPTMAEARENCLLEWNRNKVWRIIDPHDGRLLEVIDGSNLPSPGVQLSLFDEVA